MKNSIKTPSQTKTKPAFSIYKTTQGVPYAAEYFDIPYVELTPELDIEDLKFMVDSIEDWARNEILKQDYEDNVKTFDHIMNGVLKDIGSEPQENKTNKLKRAYNFIKKL